LRIYNIFFDENIHRYAGEKPSLNQKSIIDYIITRQRAVFKIQDARIKQGLNYGSDYAVVNHICFLAEINSTAKDPS
jgi:hypothetical protein